jgi:hypothetical protein
MSIENFSSSKSVLGVVLGTVSMLSAYTATAATIELTPTVVNEPVGSSFLLNLDGRDFSVGTNGSASGGTSGGGLEITWDSSVVDLQGGLAGVNITFAGDQFFAGPPVLGAGSLTLDLGSFFGDPNVDFPIAELTFDAVAPGVTTTVIDVSLSNVWADYDAIIDMTPTGIGSTITVTSTAVVPVPAAVWLFGSGLLGLVGVARRRSHQAA